MSRAGQRTNFSDSQRIQLLEVDVDEIENTGKEIAAAVRRLTWVLVGAIISFTTSAIILAWQVALKA